MQEIELKMTISLTHISSVFKWVLHDFDDEVYSLKNVGRLEVHFYV